MADLGFNNAVIVIAGPKGTGKTLGAATYLPPSKIGRLFYHDGENSASRFREALAKQGMEIGHYKDLDDRWKELDLPGDADLIRRIRNGSLPWVNTQERDALINYWQFILDDIVNNMEQDKYEVYVHDPVDRLESAMAAWVEKNKGAAGWSKYAFGEMWHKGVYPLYRGFIHGLFDRGIKTVIFTAHLGQPWEDNKPVVNKVRPKAKPELFALTQLYLWLVKEPSNPDGAPAALVLKERLCDLGIDLMADSWTPRRMVPRRIPHFSWNDVARYLQEGCDLSNPAPGESLSQDEQDLISETYNSKQMELMLLAAKKEYEEAKTQAISVFPTSDGGEKFSVPGTESKEEQAHKLQSEGKALPVIAKELGLPVPVVSKWFE